jgi:hypothetical protein
MADTKRHYQPVVIDDGNATARLAEQTACLKILW